VTFRQPHSGLIVMGIPALIGNTQRGESCCAATGSAQKWRRATAEESSEWTRLKKTRGQGAGNTPTALTRPLPTTPEGGQAVQKPRSSLYATPSRRAVTSPGAPVAILTASVVA
jgi:hypothetical protein